MVLLKIGSYLINKNGVELVPGNSERDDSTAAGLHKDAMVAAIFVSLLLGLCSKQRATLVLAAIANQCRCKGVNDEDIKIRLFVGFSFMYNLCVTGS
jgi:hypothetical protein